MPDGGLMILTCLSALMKLLDDSGVTSFETDTTFKRIKGEMNEWEVVLFLKSLQRGEQSFSINHSVLMPASYSCYHRSRLRERGER